MSKNITSYFYFSNDSFAENIKMSLRLSLYVVS